MEIVMLFVPKDGERLSRIMNFFKVISSTIIVNCCHGVLNLSRILIQVNEKDLFR